VNQLGIGRLVSVVALGVALAIPARAPVRAFAASGGPAAVLIFAAASMQTVIDALAPAIQRATGVSVRTSYAASSALARQIESGAPADLFISADLDWMDYLQSRAAIRVETRANLAGNRLVLVAPVDSTRELRIRPGFPIAAGLGNGRLAVADPESVPAGRYAKAALESLGVWPSVSSRLAAAENVRAALLLVSRGETPLGIVYHTDAVAERGVRIVDTFPENTHAPIVYPTAITTQAPSAADAGRVLTFLRSETALAVFRAQGFTAPPAARGP